MINFAFKTRVHLNKKQRSVFNRWAGSRRYAFNYALDLCNRYRDSNEGKLPISLIDEYDKVFNAGKYPLGFVKKTRSLPCIGTAQHEWYREVPSSIGQAAIKEDLKRSWKSFFAKKSKQPPQFQGRSRKKSFYLSNGELKQTHITVKSVCLPKNTGTARLGDLPKWFSRSHLMGTTFSLNAGKWYVSFSVEMQDEDFYRKTEEREKSVGVDIGVVKYAALSNGEFFYAPRKLKKLEKRTACINRKISANDRHRVLSVVTRCPTCCTKEINGYQDKKKFCNECKENLKGLSSRKTKLLNALKRTKAKQVSIRDNMSHQLTTDLVKRFDKVAIEDLSVKAMTQSAKGTVEEPGTDVKKKSRYNRALLNVAPYRFRTQLGYKSSRYGAQVALVPPKDTSITCSECGHIEEDNRKTQARFVCQSCGYTKNADVNAAINIDNRGNAPE